MRAAVARGRGAIVLVPEIALTPQTLGRFRARFGDRVAVLHSGLSDAERRDERERIASGEAPVVVGARSAVFAPLPRLGLVCVDEEHDPSYKQESDPRYDARTVAAKRAALEGAVAVYGSATPRPESWARLERLELGTRLGAALPPVSIVDMRREAGYPLSAPLLAELARVEREGGKAILLLNRRGLVPALHCRTCGDDEPLPAAATSRSSCTRTGRSAATTAARAARPRALSGLRLAGLVRVGAGTQRLERELESTFPAWSGSASTPTPPPGPGELQAALERFSRADRAVLLGTQMVAKGHHFDDVALAAVVDADTGLAMPDFRAEERTFQLITQLAGRSGRTAPGRVVVQTFQPDARAVVLAARHDVPASSRKSCAAARSSAIRPTGTSCASSSRAGTPTTRAVCSRRSATAGRSRRDRARAAPPPPWPLPRAADRQDERAAARRLDGRTAPRGRDPGDAPRRPAGRRRRRPAEPVGRRVRLAARRDAGWLPGRAHLRRATVREMTRTGGHAMKPRFSQRGTLAVVCLATAMLMLDIAVVNTALSHIADDLNSSLSGLQWIVDAYTLALATVVLTAGSVADRIGRRRVFAWGMARVHRHLARLRGWPTASRCSTPPAPSRASAPR